MKNPILVGKSDFSYPRFMLCTNLLCTKNCAGNEGYSMTENKIILDYVQKEKIRQSDLVLVIDKDKYIGSSTKNQIEYAKFLNKRVLYYSKGDVKKL